MRSKTKIVDFVVISGGQTGVDRAALDAAISLGYPYGGWLPKGRLAEDGPLPDSYVGMKEMPTKNYIRRTEQNVVDSDLTIVICHGTPEGGTKRTIDFCVKHSKPHHVVNLDLDVGQQLDAARAFIDKTAGRRMNFAGPRGSKNPSIYSEAKVFVERLVTPIMRTADLDALQKVVRALRHAGAKANSRTGLHVHVGAADFTPENLKNLVRTFYKQEELILKAAGTEASRINRYTRKTDHAFVDKICAMRHPTMRSINEAWFGRYNPNPYHYDDHRYRALNLNNLWNDKHTIEYRFYNGTTHAGQVKTAVQLSILIALRAKNAKASSAKNPRPYSEASAKYDFRVFLLRLGANGSLFKTMRFHLCKNLPGSAAWKDGRVNGVLYCVTPTELHRLDAYEGYPKVYDCIRVSVHAELMNEEAVRYRVPAFTYVMTEAARRERNGKRYPEDYRITCAVGARYWKLPNNPFGILQPVPEKRGWFGLW